MGLADDVKARYAVAHVEQVTNPKKEEATSLDSGRLDLAVTDVEAAFEVYAGHAYSSTDKRDRLLGVDGVEARLLVLTGNAAPDALERWEGFKADLREYKLVRQNDRFGAKTTGVAKPTKEDRSGTVAPDFDRDRFKGVVLGGPLAANEPS